MLSWLLALELAVAAPEAVAWDELSTVADAAFARGPGAAYRSMRAGVSSARGAEVRSRVALHGMISPTFHPGAPLWDDNNQASLGFTIGDLRGRRLARWQAQTALLVAEEEADRLAYLDAVRGAWLDAWTAAAFAAHLEEHAERLDERVRTLHPAAERGVLPRALVEDLSVELGRLRAEAALYEQQAGVASVRLAALLGATVGVDLESLPPLEEARVDRENPWRLLQTHIEQLPEVRRLEAEAEALRADARVLRAHPPSVVEVGGIYRPVEDGGWGTVGPMVSVSVPLNNPALPEARAVEGQAAARRIRRDFALAQLHAEVAAEARALDAAVDRHERLVETVERPLRARLDRLTEALAMGATSVEAVILASRDLHEAFHDRAQTTADIFVRRARGQALVDHLGRRSAP